VTESILAPETETTGQRPMPPLVSGALPLAGHALQFLADTRKLLERGYAEHGDVFRLRLGRRAADDPPRLRIGYQPRRIGDHR